MQHCRSVLIFGVGELQKSIINRAKGMGLYTVGIDPCADAVCKDDVDAFEVVGGQDFEGTLNIAQKYNVSAIVTAATDKPLIMMAKIAKELHLPFFSEETAAWSTDKFQMKQRFLEGGVPCARGRLIKSADEADDLYFPLIVKPRDNSGSRGVIFCRTKEELKSAIEEALSYSRLETVLVEEFIEGQEYSIESLHFEGKTEVIQFTEKKTTEFPYNVELGHKQPAILSEWQKEEIRKIISKISQCLNFENCPSHTELKINERGIFVIETSPRLGGDYITSHLVPLSTGINIEDQLLRISLGEAPDIVKGRVDMASGVSFFHLEEGIIKNIDLQLENLLNSNVFKLFDFKLKVGDSVPNISNSLCRYGEFIMQASSRPKLDEMLSLYNDCVKSFITVELHS